MSIKLQEKTLYLRTDKENKDGSRTLDIRFKRIEGKEPKFSMGIKLLPSEWDSESQKILDPVKDAILQRKVNRIMTEVRKAELDVIELTKEILREVVSKRKEKSERPENQSFYAYYNDYISKRTNTGKIGESTLKGYETTLKSLREFRAEIRIKDITAKLLSDFEKFLIKRGEESGKGDVKGNRYNRIKHIRAVIKYIEAQNIPIKNPYRTGDLALPEDIVNDVFLEAEEVERLYELLQKYKEGSKQYRVLIMYLFACSTGLRIGDTMTLKWKDLIVESDPLVLGIIMQKTNKKLYLPIFPIAEDMLVRAPEKNIDNVEHNYHIFYFNKDNQRQTINETLREIASEAGIQKHIDRKSVV